MLDHRTDLPWLEASVASGFKAIKIKLGAGDVESDVAIVALLLEIGRVKAIRGYDESYLSIRTPEVLARIQRGDPSWEQMVPAAVAEIIKA